MVSRDKGLVFSYVQKNTAWSKILQPCFLHEASCPLLPQPQGSQSWAPALLSPDIRSIVRTMTLLNVKMCSLSGSKVLHCCPAKKHSCFFGQRSNWNLNKKECAVEKHCKHTFSCPFYTLLAWCVSVFCVWGFVILFDRGRDTHRGRTHSFWPIVRILKVESILTILIELLWFFR